MGLKALSYSLNGPTKELVYIPTSAVISSFVPEQYEKQTQTLLNTMVKHLFMVALLLQDIKFKARSWIECFGSRFAKAVGSVFNSQVGSGCALRCSC